MATCSCSLSSVVIQFGIIAFFPLIVFCISILSTNGDGDIDRRWAIPVAACLFGLIGIVLPIYLGVLLYKLWVNGQFKVLNGEGEKVRPSWLAINPLFSGCKDAQALWNPSILYFYITITAVAIGIAKNYKWASWSLLLFCQLSYLLYLWKSKPYSSRYTNIMTIVSMVFRLVVLGVITPMLAISPTQLSFNAQQITNMALIIMHWVSVLWLLVNCGIINPLIAIRESGHKAARICQEPRHGWIYYN